MKKIYIKMLDTNHVITPKILSSLKKYYDVEFSDNPQFLFYGWDHNEFLYAYQNSVRIAVNLEDSYPDFNTCDYAIGTTSIDAGEKYFWYPFAFAFVDSKALEKRPHFDVSYVDRKFCNFVYSNSWLGYGPAFREKFCLQLAKYKHVDCPGASLNNMTNAISPRTGLHSAIFNGKLEFIKKYKFTIAYENAYDNGYITEKLSHPLLIGSLPIYKGAGNVEKVFNKDAIINADNFKNNDELIEFVKYLDNNPQEYLKKLNAPVYAGNFTSEEFEKRFDDFLINIMENGKRQNHVLHAHNAVPTRTYDRFIRQLTNQVLTPLVGDSRKANDLVRNCMGREGAYDFVKRHDRIVDLLEPVTNRIKTLTSLEKRLGDLPDGFFQTGSDDVKTSEIMEQAAIIAEKYGKSKITWIGDSFIKNSAAMLLKEIWPYDVQEFSPKSFSVDKHKFMLDQPAENDLLIIISNTTSAREKAYKEVLASYDARILSLSDRNPDLDKLAKEMEASIESVADKQKIHLVLDMEGSENKFFALLKHDIIKSIQQIHLPLSIDIGNPLSIYDKVNQIKELEATHIPVFLHGDLEKNIYGFNSFLLPENMKIIFRLKNENEDISRYDEIVPRKKFASIVLDNFYIGKLGNITDQ